jgi:V-type H+-transporting ATPase subunit C
MMEPPKKEIPDEQKIFWFVSAPNSQHGGSAGALSNVKARIAPAVKFVCKFRIPELRIGTLDTLLTLSEDLIKRDTFMEGVVRKIARQLHDLYCEGESAAPEDDIEYAKVLMVNGSELERYFESFEWDEAKYKLSSPLKDIVEAISLTISKIDEELRTKAGTYQALVHSIAAEKRKATGNLVLRDLSDIVNPEMIIDTEYFATLFVVVPKAAAKDWLGQYETLTEDVVPRSSQLIHSDSEFNLYSVILFKKKVDDFKTQARLKRWTVRDVKFEAKSPSMNKDDLAKQESKRKKQKNHLIRWCRLNFGEAFIAWSHLKAVRVFVETVLRFGLPPDYTAFVIEPTKNGQNKLRKALDMMYAGLDSAYLKETEDDSMSAFVGGDKFYPYVWSKMQVGTGVV